MQQDRPRSCAPASLELILFCESYRTGALPTVLSLRFSRSHPTFPTSVSAQPMEEAEGRILIRGQCRCQFTPPYPGIPGLLSPRSGHILIPASTDPSCLRVTTHDSQNRSTPKSAPAHVISCSYNNSLLMKKVKRHLEEGHI